MPKHDVIVIGDSLAAIHCALELARGDISLLFVRPDNYPTEVHETPRGAFDSDIASGCDMSYYFAGENAGNLYGLADKIEKHPFSYRLKTPSLYFEEPTRDYDFQVELVKVFPAHKCELMSFICHSKFIHELADEIEIKTGVGTKFRDIKSSRLFTQLSPWSYNTAKSLIMQSFSDFLAPFNLPEEFNNLYEVMCHDQFGLGPDSIDALSGVELITRRFHGLSYPKGGWMVLKDAMLESLRNRQGVKIIGGKRIDLFKSSAGTVCEIYIDERGEYSADWFVIDETLGLMEKESYGAACGRYIPIGCHSQSHVNFRLFAGWESKPINELPVGVNYFYRDMRFPPQAPHLVRFDIMPTNDDDPYDLVSRLTVRGQYPWERIVSSSGYKVGVDEIKEEILDVMEQSFSMGEPSYVDFALSRDICNPHLVPMEHKKIITSGRFASENNNIRIIYATSLNGGSMRLAFRSAERIARNIIRNIGLRKNLRDIISIPISKTESFRNVAQARMEEIK